MADQFASQSKGRAASASRHITLASGANTLADVPDWLYCLAAGTATVTDSEATAVAYVCTAGQTLPLRMSNINVASGTFIAWYL